MIDQAGIMMAQGRSIASERIQGVNDNMSKSHYHDYFELYYLEEGERYHIIQDRLYCIHPGEFLIFSPYVMHHSYGQENVPFKRLLVYFSREEVDSKQLLKALEQGTGEAGTAQPYNRCNQLYPSELPGGHIHRPTGPDVLCKPLLPVQGIQAVYQQHHHPVCERHKGYERPEDVHGNG